MTSALPSLPFHACPSPACSPSPSFGAAPERAKPMWTMSVVPTTTPDSQPPCHSYPLTNPFNAPFHPSSIPSFGAGLERAKPVWAMNVVPTTHPDTLPVVFERGLLGVFHDCCELFITYPRTDDLVHSDHHFGKVLTEKR
ncbi:unnamed protein product [Closterium sp. NIES-54]